MQRACANGSSCSELLSKQQGAAPGQQGAAQGQQPVDNKNINMDQFPNLVASAQIKEIDDILEPDETDEVKPGRELSDEEKKFVREKTFEAVGGND